MNNSIGNLQKNKDELNLIDSSSLDDVVQKKTLHESKFEEHKLEWKNCNLLANSMIESSCKDMRKQFKDYSKRNYELFKKNNMLDEKE